MIYLLYIDKVEAAAPPIFLLQTKLLTLVLGRNSEGIQQSVCEEVFANPHTIYKALFTALSILLFTLTIFLNMFYLLLLSSSYM